MSSAVVNLVDSDDEDNYHSYAGKRRSRGSKRKHITTLSSSSSSSSSSLSSSSPPFSASSSCAQRSDDDAREMAALMADRALLVDEALARKLQDDIVDPQGQRKPFQTAFSMSGRSNRNQQQRQHNKKETLCRQRLAAMQEQQWKDDDSMMPSQLVHSAARTSAHAKLARMYGIYEAGMENALAVVNPSDLDTELKKALHSSKVLADAELRKQQDEEMRISIALDQSKEAAKLKAVRQQERTKRRAAEAAAQIEHQAAAVAKARQARAERRKARWEATAEPAAGAPRALTMRLEMPGFKAVRRFDGASAKLSTLIDWARSGSADAMHARLLELTLPGGERVLSSAPRSTLSRSLASAGLNLACVRAWIVVEEDKELPEGTNSESDNEDQAEEKSHSESKKVLVQDNQVIVL